MSTVNGSSPVCYYSISVVIVNYKSYLDTISYARRLLLQKQVDLKIVIVDNRSPNESLNRISSEFKSEDRIHVIDGGRNGGYSYGNNIGLKYVEDNRLSEYVIISNNDVELEEETFIYRFISEYEELPEDKAFASPIMYANGKPSAVAALKLPSLTGDIINSSRVLSKLFGKQNRYRLPDENYVLAVDCLPGSFFLGRIDIFKVIGYFDEKVFLFGEEKIIGEKIRKERLQNYLLTGLRFIHATSKTINEEVTDRQKKGLQDRSKLYFWKVYGQKSYIELMVLKLVLMLSRWGF